MKRIFVLLFLTLGTLNAAQTRRALIFGNNAYPGNALKNARNDADAVASTLASLGYVTMLQLDANYGTMTRSLQSFDDSIHPGDIALLFYSGHGIQDAGENYLVPTDFSARTSADLRRKAISLSEIVQQFADHGAIAQIIILDSCRSDPFSTTRSLQSQQGGWAPMLSPAAGTFIAFGTAPGSTASDNPGEQHGLFTKVLLEHLSDPVDIDQLFERVRQEVTRESNGLQVPWIASNLMGSLHIVPQLDSTNSAPILPSAWQTIQGNSRNREASRSTVVREAPWGPRPANPASVQILVNEGLQLAGQQNYPEAIRSFSEALVLNPECEIALRTLGLIFHLLGRHADAMKELTRAMSIDPQDKLAYYYRALVEVSTDPSEAVRDCEVALGLDPTFADAHLALADALLHVGRPEQAFREANEGIRLAPNVALGYALRGRIASILGMYVAASRDYNTAVRLDTGK